jgi:hypothetical protein
MIRIASTPAEAAKPGLTGRKTLISFSLERV